METSSLYDLSHTIAAAYLKGFERPWEAVPGICALVRELGSRLDPSEYDQIADSVWVHRTATVLPSAVLIGPVIIGPGTGVYHCAVVRSGALIGSDCIIGSFVELKNVIVMDNAEISHFNYVGDSIVGHRSHFGAGAVTSNVKSDRSSIHVRCGGDFDTECRKLGALVGDRVEIGCNTVLNPGVIIGRNATLYPCLSVRGTIAENSILKTGGVLVRKH